MGCNGDKWYWRHYQYRRPWWQRWKCFFLGHMHVYRRINIGRAGAFAHLSSEWGTEGHCVRCGWAWDYLETNENRAAMEYKP